MRFFLWVLDRLCSAALAPFSVALRVSPPVAVVDDWRSCMAVLIAAIP